MGNHKSTNKTGAAVYNKKRGTVTVDTKWDTRGSATSSRGHAVEGKNLNRPNSYNSIGTMTTDEEPGISVSRSTTYLLEQREGAATGSSGYAKAQLTVLKEELKTSNKAAYAEGMANGLSLTSETGRKLLSNVNESIQKEKNDTGSVNDPSRKGLKRSDETRLRRSFRSIKEELEPDPVVDCFIRDGFMSEDDRERIKLSGTRRDQVDALVCMLVRMQEGAFENFCKYLDETDYGYVKEDMYMTNNYEIEKTTLSNLATKILKNKHILVDQLEPDAVAEYFVEYGVISFEEYTIVRSKSLERPAKAEKLIELVLAYQPKSFDVLIHALRMTKGDYCIDVLKNSQIGNLEIGAAPASFQKISVCKEANGTCKKRLKGVDKFELQLEFRNKDIELEIVQDLNKCTVKLAINDELSEKKLVYTQSEYGSVIIRLRVLSQDKRHGIRAGFTAATIMEVLNVFLKHSRALQRYGGQVFDVKLETSRTIGKKTMRTRVKVDPKITIKRNLALLEEELDAISLMKDLHEIFTEDEVTDILQNGNPRRKERTRRMLLKLLEKNNDAIEVFINLLRLKKKDLVVNQLLKKEGLSLTQTDMLEAENISRLVINISPLIIEKECIAMGIVNINDFRVIQCREARAKSILQNLMAKPDDEINHFAQVLHWYHQIPRGVVSCKSKLEERTKNKPTLLHIGEFKIEKYQHQTRKIQTTRANCRQYLKSSRTTEFKKGSTSSCSSNESGYASHMSLDSTGYEKRSPRETALSPLAIGPIHSNNTSRNGSTVVQIHPVEKYEANTFSSMPSLDNFRSKRRRMPEEVLRPLTSHTSMEYDFVFNKNEDVKSNPEKKAKPQLSRSFRQIIVTPVIEEN